MKNKLFLIGLMVLLAFSMVLTGCGGDDTTEDEEGADGINGTFDARLNGTWDGPETYYKFNNGSYEYGMDYPFDKGTYTTNNGELTITITHIYSNDESKWYSKSELTSLLEQGLLEELDEELWAPYTYPYSISGDKLYITYTEKVFLFNPDGPFPDPDKFYYEEYTTTFTKR